MGIAAESKPSTCFSPGGRKTTHRCYSSTTNFLIRHHLLLLPNLSFFSKSVSAALGRAVLDCYQTSFSPQQEFPLLPAPGGAAALTPPPQAWERPWGLMAPGYRIGKCWVEKLEMVSGREPPPLHPVFTHTPAAHP